MLAEVSLAVKNLKMSTIYHTVSDTGAWPSCLFCFKSGQEQAFVTTFRPWF